jgi:hypothetical protein
MTMKKNSLFYTWLLCLSAFLVLTIPNHAHAYAPVHDDAFYTPPADLSGYMRGDLIRWEQEPDMNAALTQYGTAYRVMYVSKGAAGNKIAVTGMVFIPSNTSAPLDAVVWAHGSVGMADQCAPSKWPMLYPVYEWPDYGQIVLTILQNGYAAIAPDYEGLGTPDPYPWLSHESAGNTIIDGVRAYRNLAPHVGFFASSRWGAWGHSEGAMAARAANVLANETAPELTFVGSVEVAGINNANVSEAFLENTLTQNTLVARIAMKVAGDFRLFPFWAYGALSALAINPEFDMTSLLGPFFFQEVEVSPRVSMPLINLAGGLCFDDWMGMFIGQHPDPDQVRNSNYMSNPTTANWVNSVIAFGGFGLNDNNLAPASGPAFLIYAGIDPLYPLAIRLPYARDLKAKKAIVYSTKTLLLANHDSVAVKSAGNAISWLQAQFAAHP